MVGDALLRSGGKFTPMRVPVLAALLVATALTGCASSSTPPSSTVAAPTSTSSASPAPRAVQVGERFSGPGTFRVGEGLAGVPIAIPPGEYRIEFDEGRTTGLWFTCRGLPCEPNNRGEVTASGIVSIEERSGEATWSGIQRDGQPAAHRTTIEIDRTDGALYLDGISIQLLRRR